MINATPAFAKPYFDAFQSTGTLPGLSEKISFSGQESAEVLQNSKDEFTRWQSLDETDADLAKGSPGEVKIASPWGNNEYEHVSFRGDTTNGQIVVFDNTPTSHYSARYATLTQFDDKGGLNSVNVCAFGEQQEIFWANLTHVDADGANGYHYR